MGIKIELHNAQFLGDVITGTAAIRDMAAIRRCIECGFEANMPSKAKEVVIDCPDCNHHTLRRKFQVRFNTGGKPHFQQIFHGNPYLEDFTDKHYLTLMVGTQIACNKAGRLGCHITEAFRLSIKSQSGFDFPMGPRIPDLHLTETEKAMPPIIEGQYWVISTGKRLPFTSKFWPPERWQAVVSAFPELTFVQVGFDDGKKNSLHYHPQLYGDNVINMVGKTQDPRSGIRELFRIVYNSAGCLSLVSSLMHVAAGFHKPCVVIGGAREPAQFELYPWHRYIHNQGSMKCVGKDSAGNDRDHQGIRSCWKQSTGACPNLHNEYPSCMMMIEPAHVIDGIQSYYKGGALEKPEARAIITQKRKPVFKMVCNARMFGGGERSAVGIANRMLLEGHDVHLIPSSNVCHEFNRELSPHVVLDSQEHPLTEPCDILMLYSNDMTMAFKDKFELLSKVQAKRKIMVLNYRLGQAGEIPWSTDWDQYIFLCRELEAEFKRRVPDCNSLILPPPVDLQPFFDADIGSLDKTLHVVRIGSQGASKYPKNIREIVQRIKEAHPAVSFTFMGGHKSLRDLKYVDNVKEFSRPVLDVLRKGNVFWYPLPDRYLDNGPRVVMEAMAAGLPVICDNRGGAAERVNEATGWLCNAVDDHVKAFAEINSEAIIQKGKAARIRAKAQFDPDRWIGAILGGWL